jgi:hypothetical protein
MTLHRVPAELTMAPRGVGKAWRYVMKAFGKVLALGLLFGAAASGSASAELATPEQKKACTPDVYRLCAGEIPNVRAITSCLRRNKPNLSAACQAVFEQR